ncbi:MAG: shikimate kinase [Chloroflexales bacterium]
MKKNTVALVGLSGTGKSTLGRALAGALGWPLLDTDAMIVGAQGRPVAAIFAELGEAAFRDLESVALAEALTGPAAVVATGGGAVLRPANRDLLRRWATVIWLDAPDAVILARLAAHAEGRPLLADSPAARLAALRATRDELYRAISDMVLDTADLDPDALAAQVRRCLT